MATKTVSLEAPRLDLAVRPEARRIWAGVAWGMAATLITSGWWVMTRFGIGGTLDPFDLAALRFGIAGGLLLPILLRFWRRIVAVPPLVLAAMAIGAGAPFALVNSVGLTFASAGNGGALMPGMIPLFTALLSVPLLGERVGIERRWGLVVIVAGVVAIAGNGLAAGLAATPGHALFLLGAMMWAAFTVALRKSGLPAYQAIAVISGLSMVGYLPAYLVLHGPGFLAAPASELLPQALFQGVLAGFATPYCFGKAAMALGAARSSVFGALVPVLATLLGLLLLGEAPTLLEWAGVAAVSAGAALASGVLRRR